MKEIKIQVPEGHQIDVEKSDLSKGVIVFKKNTSPFIEGYYITTGGNISVWKTRRTYEQCYDVDKGTFRTEALAKSALAMAQISQIMTLDDRFGDPITDEEWLDGTIIKYSIDRKNNRIHLTEYYNTYVLLAFRTADQRNLFLKEYEALVNDYLMLPVS